MSGSRGNSSNSSVSNNSNNNNNNDGGDERLLFLRSVGERNEIGFPSRFKSAHYKKPTRRHKSARQLIMNVVILVRTGKWPAHLQSHRAWSY